MNLKGKIWLWLGVLMGTILLIDLAIGYRKLAAEMRTEAEFDAHTVYGFMMASRNRLQP